MSTTPALHLPLGIDVGSRSTTAHRYYVVDVFTDTPAPVGAGTPDNQRGPA